MFQIGELVCSKYRIISLLGRGASGDVYLVEHINLNINRALKCIRRSPFFVGMDIREADILKNLRHPSIPIIYDIEERDDCVCIIEEYIEGLSLNSFVNSHSRISHGDIIRITLQLCEVVSYLHERGILHADIKPENIICNDERIYLIDYGNARVAGNTHEPLIGTKGFVAPEIYTAGSFKESSDIYSIGVVMLLLATGNRDMEALRSIHNKQLKRLITKCLSHSEKERINSVKDLSHSLNRLISTKVKSEKVSLKIGFAGAYAHCGVTHCALLAGNSLMKKGEKVVLCERNCSNDYIKILAGRNYLKFKKGIFKADGLYYVPWYYQCVTTNTESWADRIIYDYGTLNEESIKMVLECDVLCIVTGARIYEREKTVILLKNLLREGFKGKLVTVINLADVKSYKKVIKCRGIINPIRLGYIPNV